MTNNEKKLRNALENVLICLKEIRFTFPDETRNLIDAAVAEAEHDLKGLE